MAQLAVFVAGLLVIAESQASDVAEAGFLSQYIAPTSFKGDHFASHTSAKQKLPNKDFDLSEIIGKDEEKAAQKLLASSNNMPITLSAIGVGVLALVMMLGVRIRRGFSPAAISLADNLLEMKSQGVSNNTWQPAVFFVDPTMPPRVQAPAGFWDPLDFSTTELEGFERSRAVEHKHGRLAMVMTLFFVDPEQNGLRRQRTIVNENFGFDFAESQADNTADGILGERRLKEEFIRSYRPTATVLEGRPYQVFQEVQEKKILSATVEAGLLRSLDELGLGLGDVEKILPIIDDLGVIGLVRKNLPLAIIATGYLLIEPAPFLLPVLGSLLATLASTGIKLGDGAGARPAPSGATPSATPASSPAPFSFGGPPKISVKAAPEKTSLFFVDPKTPAQAWDPLELEHYGEAQLTHGRVAMSASLGFLNGKSGVMPKRVPRNLVDPFKEIENTLDAVSETKLLTKLADTGLLSKAQRAGLRFSDLEPLLLFAEENGLLGLLGDLNDELLPLLPLLVRLAPPALPVVSLALGLGPLNFLLAAASLGGAVVVTGMPDNSVQDVAVQTALAVPLATLFPVLFGGLGLVGTKLG